MTVRGVGTRYNKNQSLALPSARMSSGRLPRCCIARDHPSTLFTTCGKDTISCSGNSHCFNICWPYDTSHCFIICWPNDTCHCFLICWPNDTCHCFIICCPNDTCHCFNICWPNDTSHCFIICWPNDNCHCKG
ncbi:uncharacterized protein LOC126990666 [Eriocheir sinensis]|uniref:uncharacterized protein LOC126990666 n=1 Tax=Eriocheir sinensis TaxID=95602 RepID=UPI0021CA36AD|nr:uncharacterized protein LOC126990666 [Eriocheir sinensis]